MFREIVEKLIPKAPLTLNPDQFFVLTGVLQNSFSF